jgi:hypothetical protein
VSFFGAARPIRRDRKGRYLVALATEERDLLAALPGQLVAILEDPSEPSLRRLFPPAYSKPEDAERQADFERLMREDLLARHQEALATLERTAHATELSEEELLGWLHSLNSLRLVLGTRLDVTEDDDPRDAATPERQLYYLLGYWQECVVDALAG